MTTTETLSPRMVDMMRWHALREMGERPPLPTYWLNARTALLKRDLITPSAHGDMFTDKGRNWILGSNSADAEQWVIDYRVWYWGQREQAEARLDARITQELEWKAEREAEAEPLIGPNGTPVAEWSDAERVGFLEVILESFLTGLISREDLGHVFAKYDAATEDG